MAMEALGMIETRGWSRQSRLPTRWSKRPSGINRQRKSRFGLVSVMVRDVGAVKAAVEAGEAAAGKLGELVASHVIPRPHTDAEKSRPDCKGHGYEGARAY